MTKAMKFVFLCILLKENYCSRAKLMETKFINVLCMHALSLNSKSLIGRALLPAFLTTQTDQSSPVDFVLRRPWKAPNNGLKFP